VSWWRLEDSLNEIRKRRQRLESLREVWLDFETSLICALVRGSVGARQRTQISKLASELGRQRTLFDEVYSRHGTLTDGSHLIFDATQGLTPDPQRAASDAEALAGRSSEERRKRALLILKEWNGVDELFVERLNTLQSREKWLSTARSPRDALGSWLRCST
jgi:hypothetical protein